MSREALLEAAKRRGAFQEAEPAGSKAMPGLPALRALIYALRGDPVHPLSSTVSIQSLFREASVDTEVVEVGRMHELGDSEAREALKRFAAKL